MDDAQVRAWLDQEDEHVAQTIRQYGVFIQFVHGGYISTPVNFGYTVGLFGLGHPELVVLSMQSRTAGTLLNQLADRIRSGTNLVPGELLTFGDAWRHRVIVEELPNPGEILFAANRHYQRPKEASVPAYQLTYDDLEGHFPWEDGYLARPNVQPRPGTWRA